MVKKIVLVVLGVLLLVVGVVLIRTLMVSSTQVAVPPIERIPVDEGALADRMATAVRFATVSHKDPSLDDTAAFDGLLAFYQTTYPRVHEALTREVIDTHGLLYTWKGSDPSLPAVVLLAHNDVVPADPTRWEHPPFSGHIDAEGNIYGRGTLDDKSCALAIFEAIEGMLEAGIAPKRTVILAFGHDEEVSGERGAQKLAAAIKARGQAVHFVLDEGMVIVRGAVPGVSVPVAFIGVSEKGYVTVDLEVKGIGGHSSMPPRDGAVEILARAITRLHDTPMPGDVEGLTRETFSVLAPELPFGQRLAFANLWLFKPVVRGIFEKTNAGNALLRTTTAPTMLQGSAQENVLPQVATAVVNFRIKPGDSIDSIVKHVTSAIDDDRVTVAARTKMGSNPSPVSPTRGTGYDEVEHTIRELFPDVVVAPNLVLGATDARNYTGLTDRVYRFAPLQLNAEDLLRLHGVDERIHRTVLADMVRFYRRLLERSAI